jgi:hypothetical protein
LSRREGRIRICHGTGVPGITPEFLAGHDVEEIPPDAVSFRALSKMTARQRDRALSAGRVALLIDDWIEARFRLPEADIPSLTGYPRSPRLKWYAPAGGLASGRSRTCCICSRPTCVQLSRLGYRRCEPDGIPRESSQLLSKVFRSIREDGEKPATIATEIGITGEELQEHVFGLTLTTLPGGQDRAAGPPRSGIRLVPPLDHS